MNTSYAALVASPLRATACNEERIALQRACTALWMATLSLMIAFMHSTAPAHRVLIARKIAKNLSMLREEEQVFTVECRMIFADLAQRWHDKADQLARHDDIPRGGVALLQPA